MLLAYVPLVFEVL